jgi:hypothetical protein
MRKWCFLSRPELLPSHRKPYLRRLLACFPTSRIPWAHVMQHGVFSSGSWTMNWSAIRGVRRRWQQLPIMALKALAKVLEELGNRLVVQVPWNTVRERGVTWEFEIHTMWIIHGTFWHGSRSLISPLRQQPRTVISVLAWRAITT